LVFGQHPGELDPIPDVGIAGDHRSQRKQRAINGYGDIELGVFCQCEHHFYVAAAQANVGRCATDRNFAALKT